MINIEEYVVHIARCADTGIIHKITIMSDGKLHALEGPAAQQFHPTTGIILREEWYRKGMPYRIDGPCSTEWHPETGGVISQAWANGTRFHRDMGKPAIWRRACNNNVLISEQHFSNGRRHCQHGPALIERNEMDGSIKREEWWQHGQKTREGDAPAVIEYGLSGVIIEEEYWLDGLRHRESGPAFIERNSDGKIIDSAVFIRGCRQSNPHRGSPKWHP